MRLKSKRIIVTGGSGFLGKAVVDCLRTSGCTNVFVPRSAEFDLTREGDINRLLDQQRPEVVIHLAALVGGIGANMKQPGAFLYNNLVMGAHLIERCRLLGVEKFVMIGTVCSYPKFTPVPFKETELWNGYPEETNAPYGLAKKMLIAQLEAYRQQYGFNGINLIVVNLYGPHDNFDLETSHVIPALIRKCIEAREKGARELVVWGSGTPTREFLFVEDAARAIVTGAEHVQTSQPINIGSGDEMSIANLARLIAKKTGFLGEVRLDPTKPDGQPRRCLDVTRARELFGFKTQVALEEGLERTIAWYEAQRRAGRAAA